MSTRSLIGKKNSDGTVTAIYCHYDGYPEHHVPILTQHYATENRVDALLALGDLSVLDVEVGEKQDFRSPRDGWCLAYGRDRCESDCEAKAYTNEYTFQNSDHYYKYMFRDGRWLVSTHDGPFVSVATSEAE